MHIPGTFNTLLTFPILLWIGFFVLGWELVVQITRLSVQFGMFVGCFINGGSLALPGPSHRAQCGLLGSCLRCHGWSGQVVLRVGAGIGTGEWTVSKRTCAGTQTLGPMANAGQGCDIGPIISPIINSEMAQWSLVQVLPL